jgi:hypothetical protein
MRDQRFLLLKRPAILPLRLVAGSVNRLYRASVCTALIHLMRVRCGHSKDWLGLAAEFVGLLAANLKKTSEHVCGGCALMIPI